MRRALHAARIGMTLAAFVCAAYATTTPAGTAYAREAVAERADIAVVKLPPEARDVLARVRAGGPFRFERDGVTFGNRERQLPVRKRGFYHEYTVVTPGTGNRGARRIVCGGPRRVPEVCYYTDDHYASFRRIRE